MEERQMNEKESLELISQMIRSTKQKLAQGSGKPFLIWGYTTFVVSTVIYFLITQTVNYHYHLLWFLIPVIGSLGMFISLKNEPTYNRNFIDRIISSIWTVIGFAGVFTAVATFFVQLPILSLEILLMGIGSALTGLVLRFKPVIITGFMGMACSALPFLIKGSEQIIVFGVVFLVMMVIPGHILNCKNRKNNV